jgi:DNA-directed RNA polymerase specialized sigma24 family protein
MATVTSEGVAAYQGMVERLAYRYVDNGIGCEYDDLVQEGLIGVWQSLERDRPPSTPFIKLCMRNWRTRIERQRRGDPIAIAYVFLAPDALEGRSVHSKRSREASRELFEYDTS